MRWPNPAPVRWRYRNRRSHARAGRRCGKRRAADIGASIVRRQPNHGVVIGDRLIGPAARPMCPAARVIGGGKLGGRHIGLHDRNKRTCSGRVSRLSRLCDLGGLGTFPGGPLRAAGHAADEQNHEHKRNHTAPYRLPGSGCRARFAGCRLRQLCPRLLRRLLRQEAARFEHDPHLLALLIRVRQHRRPGVTARLAQEVHGLLDAHIHAAALE